MKATSLTDAVLAVEWLNASKGTEERAKVLEIRDELEQLGRMLDLLHQEHKLKKPMPKDSSQEDRSSWRLEQMSVGEQRNQLRIRHNELNERLSDYCFRPAMVYDVNRGVWRYTCLAKASGFVHPITRPDSLITVSAAAVVGALVRLAASRNLQKVRLCEQCKENWLLSERKMDRFCGQQCREVFDRARPDFKDRKRRNQKNYRENQKRKDANSLARARELRKGNAIGQKEVTRLRPPTSPHR
jgi:hypothetical protein